jgi:hypothetical protein
MVPNQRKPGLREIVADGSRYEHFCTVLLEQVSESVGVPKMEEKECF